MDNLFVGGEPVWAAWQPLIEVFLKMALPMAALGILVATLLPGRTLVFFSVLSQAIAIAVAVVILKQGGVDERITLSVGGGLLLLVIIGSTLTFWRE